MDITIIRISRRCDKKRNKSSAEKEKIAKTEQMIAATLKNGFDWFISKWEKSSNDKYWLGDEQKSDDEKKKIRDKWWDKTRRDEWQDYTINEKSDKEQQKGSQKEEKSDISTML